MKEEHIEESFLLYLASKLDDLAIDIGGNFFSASKVPKEWIEPRLPVIDHSENTTPGEEFDDAQILVRCYIRVGKKGGRRGALSRLVDRVRGVIDAVEAVAQGNAAQFAVNDNDGDLVANMQFQGTTVERSRNELLVIDEKSQTNVDVAVITGQAIADGGSC